MVKVAFICEGATEFIIITSEAFKAFLLSHNLQSVKEIDATGNGNLLPHNIREFDLACKAAGAQRIFVLCDLETSPCVTERKQLIDTGMGHIHIIAKKEIEAWFLSDDIVMSALLRGNFNEPNPENIISPFLHIDSLCQQHISRGIGNSKPKFARKIINLGFDIERAATHPNCNSAKYFIDKLISVTG